MIIKSFIYGFEIMFLHQLYPPSYVLLEIPRGYICRWTQCGNFIYLVALEWKRHYTTWILKILMNIQL